MLFLINILNTCERGQPWFLYCIITCRGWRKLFEPCVQSAPEDSSNVNAIK